MKKILNLFIVGVFTFIGIIFINAKANTNSYGFDTTDCVITGNSETCKLKLIVDGKIKLNKLDLTIQFYNITYNSFKPTSNWAVASNVEGENSSIRKMTLYSMQPTFTTGTYTIGEFTASDAKLNCYITVTPSPNNVKCQSVTIGDNTIYYGNDGSPVTYYQYRTQCDVLTCEIIKDDDGNTVYYNKAGVIVDETTYNVECLGKKYCKIDNNKYYGKDGNEVGYIDYERQCNKHSCTIITDGSTTIYFDSTGAEVNQEAYYNDANCQEPCGVVNGIYFDKNGNVTTELEYRKQCLKNECVALSDGTYYGKDGNVTTKDEYLKQCFSCIKTDDKYYDANGKEITAEEYDLQCNVHKCEKVNDTYFNKEGIIVDEKTYNLECNKHICEIVNDTYFNKEGLIVDEKTYNLECKEHKCEEIDGKYFDDKGKIVSKDEFTKSCGVENPPTGNFLPVIYLVIGISISTILFYVSKKYRKLHN